MKLLASLLLIASLAAAQDTTYCNDGWELYTNTWQGQEHHSCFWFGTNYEKVSHDTAKTLCAAMGGFMAEVPYGPHLNNWLVNKLIERSTKNNLPTLKAAGEGGLGAPVFENQFWLGARDFGHHTTTCPDTGCGSTGTRPSSGSTGAKTSPTTIADRTASPTFSTEMSSLVNTVPSTGTTGTVTSLLTLSAKKSSTRLSTPA